MSDSLDDDSSHIVTAFVRNRGEVVLLRRSDAVGTYHGQWGAVSGFAEGDPDEQVRTEIHEETGLADDAISLVRSGRPVRFEDGDLGREWVVHPYLFDVDTREIDLSEEHDALEWAHPTVIATVGAGDADDAADGGPVHDAWADRETVPELWTAYERVAPTVRSIAADDEHGAAVLSIRALEVLRDRAGLLVAERAELGVDPEGEREELAALAERLLEARPSMAVLRNRVNRTMAVAAETSGSADDAIAVDFAGAPAVLEAAIAGIDRAVTADDGAAAHAADRLEGRVVTLSRSDTVLDALRLGDPARVFVAESRPGGEGVDVAETLANDLECPITVHTDAAVAHVLEREAIDRVVVGADTILPDGSVVNKTGTRAMAVAAARDGVPVTVVAATDKISTREEVNLESGSREAVYDGETPIDVLNPTFDVTPADCVSEVVTERGAIPNEEIEAVAGELRALEDWRES
ncbi:NUDIX domain-containing protein [Natrarchaeobaculum sulfurireducens]|uniref:Translation initiation factor eIF-2B alpha subunit n=1 Tax=Natrarchaeobaculum sulfurireducens TaxID=2044521 RepID=A0A346PLB3_9EURY|nr:NUDIX domain-containing protein [Natrarchaeobaculum sulfurireducens]AXR80308.1 translation initiation factor eIF-2B alpha subunit [Natrarchaeobaculum sulfurireducens]